jgi:hypothetical protein
MKTNHTNALAAAGLVGLTVVVASYLWWTAKREETKASPMDSGRPSVGQMSPSVGKQVTVPAVASATGHIGRTTHSMEKSSPVAETNAVIVSADRAAADKMENRLENDDSSAALKIARELMRSEDAEVRSRVVATLGWIGIRALPELSGMLGDERADVAAEAFQQWKEAVEEVTDDAMKGQLLVAGMQTMTSQDDLEASVMEFNSLPDDVAVRGLVTVIQSSNKIASEVARDHYSFVTGNDYTTPADAEKWISQNVTVPTTTAK